jgi:hypothetical protein
MLRDFSDPALAQACEIAARGLTPQEAVSRFNDVTKYVSEAGLTVDMGRRAIARCAAEHGDAKQFMAEFFAEATSYYASRDLPSYVAAPGRIAGSTDSIRLKESLRQATRQQVESVGQPRLAPRQWSQYIREILSVLRSESRTK